MKKIISIVLSTMIVFGCLSSALALSNEELSQDNVILASVNDEDIASPMVNYLYVINRMMYEESNGLDKLDEQTDNSIYSSTLQRVIAFVLIKQEACRLGMDNVPEETLSELSQGHEESWEGLLDMYIEEASANGEELTKEQAEAKIKEESGITKDFFMNNGLAYDEISEIYSNVANYYAQDVEVTEEEIKQRYEDLVKDHEENFKDDIEGYEYYTVLDQMDTLYTPEGYKRVNFIYLKVDEDQIEKYLKLRDEIAVIASNTASGEEPQALKDLLNSQDELREQILNSRKETTDEIFAKLNENVSFEDLIDEYSENSDIIDLEALKEGFLIHEKSIAFDPNVVEAAKTLENVGDVLSPIIGDTGIYIFHYAGDVDSGRKAFTDEIRDEIYDVLLNEKVEKIMDDKVSELKSQSMITYTSEGAKRMKGTD